MKKNCFAMLLSLTLAASMLAGCGTAASSQKESAAVSETAAVTAAVTTAAPTAESSAESASSEQASAETASEPVAYSLPLTDTPTTFSIFTTAAPGFMTPYLGDGASYNTAESTYHFTKLTGVTIKYIEQDMMSFSENFNLMIASGDYPDLLTGVSGYSGGYTKALDDGVILDLTDYVKNDMPAYLSCIEDAGVMKDVMDDEGKMLSICSINNETVVDRGPVVRQDWMDKLGLDAPKTYDDWYDMGLAMLNGYDIDYAFYFSSTLNPSITFSAGYDLPAIDLTTSGSHFYQVDGKVQSALVSDNFKNYLKMMNKWYSAGLMSRDFFSTSSQDVKNAFAGDACAACWDNADFITEDNTNEELKAKGFSCAAVPVTLQKEDQTLHFSLGVDGLVQSGICISTDCVDPDLLVKVLDYSFTKDGALLSNYGIEGVSYEMNDKGEPEWTEAMSNVPGQTFRATTVTYLLTGLPTCVDVERFWSETYDEDSMAAVELWSGAKTEADYDMPTALYFTTDEATTYSVKITDVETYANEYILACVTGDNDIDATWDSYVEKLWSLGLQDCIDAEQGAYDRYQSRA